MTEIRIRWSDEPASCIVACTGSVGTVDPAVFQIFAPDHMAVEWILATSLPGMEESRSYRDGPAELKADAEGWLSEFVASLGAIFPEDAYEFPVRELDLEEAFGSGAYVRYQHPDAGWPGEQGEARKLLTHGRLYRVAWNDIGSSRTIIGLVGVKGRFNSVLFEPVASEDVTDAEAAEVAARTVNEPAKES